MEVAGDSEAKVPKKPDHCDPMETGDALEAAAAQESQTKAVGPCFDSAGIAIEEAMGGG